MSQRIVGREVDITIVVSDPKRLMWCVGCRNLSESRVSHWEVAPARCRRGRGDVGRTTCYEPLRELRSDQALVDAILAAYAVGGWDAAVAVWIEAGAPRL